MSVKAKLIWLLLLGCLILGGAVSHILLGTWNVRRQVQLFLPATDYLLAIARAQAAVTAQAKEALDHLIATRQGDLDEFNQFGTVANRAFQAWQNAIDTQRSLGVAGEDEDLAEVLAIEADYRRWRHEVAQLLELHAGGDIHQHRNLLHLAPRHAEEHAQLRDRVIALEEQLFPRFEAAMADGFLEVENTYHALLLEAGRIALPLLAPDASHPEQIHTMIDVVIGAYQLDSAANLQLAALLRYLLSGTPADLEHYRVRSALGDRAYQQWRATLEQPLPSVEVEDYLAAAEGFLATRALMNDAIAMKQRGETEAAFALAHEELDLNPLGDEAANLQRSLKRAGDDLIALAGSISRIGSLVLLGGVVLVLVALTLEFRRLLRRGRQLREGMLKVGSGDLDCRVRLRGGDELAELGAVFDGMVDDLQRSRNQLEALNRELELKVVERTAALEEKNNELEAFNSMVSHDLRSQLTIISGMAQLLQDRWPASEGCDEPRLIQRILDAGQRMQQIIESMHSLARMNHGDIEMLPVDLSLLATELGAAYRQRYAGNVVEFKVRPGMSVLGDRNLLLILLDNLLGNAWKYSSGREVSRIELGCEQQDGEAVIFLRDNGIGFNQTEEQKLFEPFQRLNSAAGFPGRGIGLATVERIVRRHGGSIWARGVPGRGAVFYLRLPGLKAAEQVDTGQVVHE